MDVVILGEVIGSATGWDPMGEDTFSFYNFTSSISELDNVDCLNIQFGTGIVEGYTSKGKEVFTKKLALAFK